MCISLLNIRIRMDWYNRCLFLRRNRIVFDGFASGLIKTYCDCEAIQMIVDRLTKTAHFIRIRMDYPMGKVCMVIR